MACKLSFGFSNWSRSFPSGFVACEHTPRFSQPIPRLHTGPPVSQVGNGTLQRGPDAPNTIRAPPIGPCGTPKRRRYFANRLPLPAGVSKLILQRGPKPPKVLSNEVPNDPLIFQQCPKPRKWFSNSSQNHESGFPTVLKIPTKHKGLAFQRLQLCTDVFSNAYSPSAFANLLRDLGPRRATPPAPTGIQNKPPAQPCTETPKSSILAEFLPPQTQSTEPGAR